VSETNITVCLYSALRKRNDTGWQNQIHLTLPRASRVQDLLDMLDLDFPAEAILVLIDRRTVPPERSLQDGDTVHLLPALSGG